MHSPTKRPALMAGASLIGAVALALSSALPASAHVTIAEKQVTAGSYQVLTFSVPHGCDGSATTKVAIKIPEGINATTPTRNGFYDVSKVMENLATPIEDGHGNKVTQRVSQVVYTAKTPLPADQRDVFALSLQIPEDAAVGSKIYFPTVQTCEKGETAWVQIPQSGQDPHSLESPSPVVEVVAAAEDHDHHSKASTSPSAASSSSASPAAGAEASNVASTSKSQTPLVVTSLVIGAAGLVVGLIALLRRPRKA